MKLVNPPGPLKELWSAEEIAEAIGRGRTAVFDSADREKWKYWEINSQGGKKRGYVFSSLPPTVQIAVQKHYHRESVMPVTGHCSLPAVNSRLPQQRRKAAAEGTLPQWADEIAKARADLVAAYFKAKELAIAKKEKSGETTKRFLQAFNAGVSHPALFKVLGKATRSTLERWRKDLEEAKYDYHVLAPQWGRHRNGSNKLSENESKILFSQVFHQNRVKIGTAVNVTKYILEQMGLPSPSSPATMRRAVEQFKRKHFDLWTFYREGEKALIDKVLPYIERDDKLLDVGDVLVADGHRCNFRVHNPWTGKPCRPLLVGFYDWKSRVLCGWAISVEEDTQVIAAALRRAILKLGKTPKIVLLDNGKAFKSRVFTGDPDLEQCGIRGLFSRLDIKTVFAWPYNARSKPIERFFGDFSNQFERYMPSFSGASISDKPASLMRNEKLMKAFYKEHILEIPQVLAALDKWWDFHAWNQHPTIPGKQKGEVFEAGRGPGLDEGKLNYLMLDAQVKRIGRNGISFLQADYFHESLYGLRDQVIVRYDFADITHVHVYAKTGEYICQANRLEKVHPMAHLLGKAKDVDELKHQIGRNRSLNKQTTKLARQALETTGELNVLQALPWNRMAEAVPKLPERIEQIENEFTGPRALAQVPVIEAETFDAIPETVSEPENSEAEVTPLFATDTEYYNHLASLQRPLVASEIEFLDEFYKTENGRVFLKMDGPLKTATGGE